ncbi:MAG: Gfo/Idh/MocA family oxidoreductase, partial [bacterium]|nr:Gfo/Idh/MocA family oxidoreductase [bacterium]
INALISTEVNLEDIHEAYKRIQGKQVLGVVVKYSHEHYTAALPHESPLKLAPKKIDVRFIPAVKDQLRVGIIGAGGFAKVKLLPIVSRLKNTKINAIVDTDIANSINVSQLYCASKTYANDDDLFVNDDVDVVVIASPHKYHCDQALKAMQHGKAVFVEKPMVTDFGQLARFKEFFKKNKEFPFCVDYNRSFAPFIQKIKRLVSKRKAPIIIQYRMNAGFISKEHWIQTDIGAGRIIGEACHVFDLFCYLTEAKPLSVSVEALHASRDDLFPTDNFCAQIRFEDGSLCSLIYTAIGHSDLGKERMEIFFDGKSIVLDDYIRLFGFGVPSWFNETMSSQDKGHETLIQQFFSGLKQESFEPPISIQRLLLVAELTLIIDKLACEDGGIKNLSL